MSLQQPAGRIWLLFGAIAVAPSSDSPVVGANNILVRRPGDEVNAIQKASKTYEASNSSIEIPQEIVL
jgi:hypothetical protein